MEARDVNGHMCALSREDVFLTLRATIDRARQKPTENVQAGRASAEPTVSHVCGLSIREPTSSSQGGRCLSRYGLGKDVCVGSAVMEAGRCRLYPVEPETQCPASVRRPRKSRYAIMPATDWATGIFAASQINRSPLLTNRPRPDCWRWERNRPLANSRPPEAAPATS